MGQKKGQLTKIFKISITLEHPYDDAQLNLERSKGFNTPVDSALRNWIDRINEIASLESGPIKIHSKGLEEV